MVVIGIMSMFLGASVALLKRATRPNTIEATGREIHALLRRARTTAQSTGTRLEVAFDFNRQFVQARVRRPLAYFSFEEEAGDDRVRGGANIVGRLSNDAALARGRTGGGMVFGLATGGEGRVVVPGARLNARDGLHVVADVRPSAARGMTIMSRGMNWALGIDDAGHLSGRVRFSGTAVTRDGQVVTDGEIAVKSAGTLPLLAWSHVEMIVDERGVRLVIDDVLQSLIGADAPLPAALDPWGDPGQQLEAWRAPPVRYNPLSEAALRESASAEPFALTPNDAELFIGAGSFGAFQGAIDNVGIQALVATEPLSLPETLAFGVTAAGDLDRLELSADEAGARYPETYRHGVVFLYYMPDGRLDPRFHTRPLTLYLRDIGGKSARVRVELMGTTP